MSHAVLLLKFVFVLFCLSFYQWHGVFLMFGFFCRPDNLVEISR